MNAVTIPEAGQSVLPDGSMVVTAEQLARLGDGDVARGRRELRLMLANEREQRLPDGPTALPPNVRLATPADEPAVVALLLRDLEENAVRTAPIDEEKVLQLVRLGTRRENGKMCFTAIVDEPDAGPVGVVVLVPQQWWWSQQWYYFEVVCYVHSDHRHKGYVNDLLNFQRWVSDEMTRKFGYRVPLLCGVLGAHRIRAKIALYRRRFTQAGAAFIYPPSVVEDQR